MHPSVELFSASDGCFFRGRNMTQDYESRHSTSLEQDYEEGNKREHLIVSTIREEKYLLTCSSSSP